MHLYKIISDGTLQHDKTFCSSPTKGCAEPEGMLVALTLQLKLESQVSVSAMHSAGFFGTCFMSLSAVLTAAGVPLQDSKNENAVDLMQDRGNTPSKPTGSLADITNSTYNKQTHMTNKVPPYDWPQ